MIKKLIAILFLTIIAAGVFLLLNFGDLAKNATEKIASEALGVKVRIGSIDISLKDKQATVNGLRISNPPGYKKPHAVTADKITIAFNDISKERIDFKKITVVGTTVNLEVTEKGTNLTDLKKRAASKPSKSNAKQPKVIIRKLTISESTLNPSVTLLNTDIASVKVPPVHLSNIGKRENGILAQEAIAQIVRQYIQKAEKKAGTAGMLQGLENNVKTIIKDNVDNITKDFKNIFN